MTLRRVRGALAALLILFAGFAGPTQAAGKRDIAKVDAAIDSIRGHDPRTLSDEENEALSKRLDKTWNVLLGQASITKKRIREVLEEERTDSFLLIDLSYLYLVLNESDAESMTSASTWLLRADPAYYPTGYYHAASLMGSARCAACLPAVLGLLRLERLSTSIPEHALPVDLDLGLLFAIGPYGSGATDALIKSLQDPSCTVRMNALKMMNFLLDPSVTPAVRAATVKDTCPQARGAAWTTLGVMADRRIGALIRERLASDEPVASEEKVGMVAGLERMIVPPDPTILQKLAGDPDSAVAAAAQSALQEPEDPKEGERLLQNVGSKSPAARTRTLNMLKESARTGRFEFEGTAFELEAMLTPSDLTAVNDARAAVLRRASDECLYEWRKLYLVGSILLEVLQGKPEPASPTAGE